jgi:hypothetical protein
VGFFYAFETVFETVYNSQMPTNQSLKNKIKIN